MTTRWIYHYDEQWAHHYDDQIWSITIGAFHLARKSELGMITPELTVFQLTSQKTKMDALFYQSITYYAAVCADKHVHR